MVRKRLGDLLREEAQKSLEAEPVELPEASPAIPEGAEAEQSPAPPDEGVKLAALQATLLQLQEREATLQQEVAAVRSQLKAQSMLETQLADLQAAVQQAQKREESLQQELTAARSQLQAQTALTQKLQADLDKAGQAILSLTEQSKARSAEQSQAKSMSVALAPPVRSPMPHAFSRPIGPARSSNSKLDVGWAD
ncbi:hypothetical protein BST81_00435 [Leptolyngbya sp. 'hensonii']|nr:hypothetical protein BST81_00435 [Leptolyngbya sp. 'hensonii']